MKIASLVVAGTLQQNLGTTDVPQFAGLVLPYVAPSADSTTAFQVRKADKSTAVMTVDTSTGNVGIGQTTFGTNAAKVLAIGSGTAPSTSPADAVQIYSSDYAAGDARLNIVGETGYAIILGNGSVLSTGDLTLNTTGVNNSVTIAATGTGAINLLAPSAKLERADGGAQYYVYNTQASVGANTQCGMYDFYAKDSASNATRYGGIWGYIESPTDGAEKGYMVFKTINTGTGGLLERLRLDGSGNVGIGQTTFGTNAAKVLAIGSGTAPSTSPADAVQIWSADNNGTAGHATLLMRNEIYAGTQTVDGTVYKTDTGDPANPYEGMKCINTFDNTYKVYADGGWRTIATW